jgi:hypothetical protein
LPTKEYTNKKIKNIFLINKKLHIFLINKKLQIDNGRMINNMMRVKMIINDIVSSATYFGHLAFNNKF